MSMGKHLVVLQPLSRTSCSLLGMKFIKFYSDRAEKRGRGNRALIHFIRIALVSVQHGRFSLNFWYVISIHLPITKKNLRELLELGEMLRVNFQCSISIVGTVIPNL